MRIYKNSYELISESMRDVYEMGHIVKLKSMQNKNVEGDEDFITKEVNKYSYCLLKLGAKEHLFITSPKNKKWAEAEFEERIAKEFTNPGEAWKLREHVWREFLDQDGQFDYTYNERLRKSIDYVVEELRRNPNSRQAVISLWDPNIDPKNIGGKKRVPCSLFYQVFIRNNKLHLNYTQRSADVVTHFGNDIYLAWLLKSYLRDRVNEGREFGDENYHGLGYLYHDIISLHSYKKDWDVLKTSIKQLENVKG